MKKYCSFILTAGLALLSGIALTGCDDKDEISANDVLEVKSVLPTKVIEGQVVTITGTGLDKVTSVVFPGNIAVKDITRVGSNYITVVTPAGISAQGGTVTVEAAGESAESNMTLTLGNPRTVRVAPLDTEVKINECVEVYGDDLEFITCAHFPGADGSDIVVSAESFRRKSTSALYIYVPAGIAAGEAAVTLEDCSGKSYPLPGITLSDKVAGGSDGQQGEGYAVVYDDECVVNTWDDWYYLGTDRFNLEGISLHPGLMMRLTFRVTGADGASVCVCDGWWGAPDMDGEGNNSLWVVPGTTQLEFPISEGMVTTWNDGAGIIIGGEGYVLEKIELYREYPTLWSGEVAAGWWWYLPAAELDLSAVTPEAGQTIRFTFVHHDEPQTFCLCDGWWGAPYIRDGGESENNIVLAGGEDFLEFEISEGMATTMNLPDETALIIGGDITVTRIQIKTF